jgi:uncharacterized protein (DUF1015 family)
MAAIAPFMGLRYDLSRVGDAARVLAPPYDVIGQAERQELEARHPENVVRLELPRGDGEARYAGAARLLSTWTAGGVLRADPEPAAYLYEQQFTWAERAYTRRGFIAAVRLEPFERRVVLPHERTLSAPKEDRRRLMRATGAQISPVFGLYRDAEGAAEAELAAATAGATDLDATTADGVRHRMWVVTDAQRLGRLAAVLRDKQILIADGHHRYETLLALRDELRPAGAPPGTAAADFGMMFLARAEDPGLLVLPTHRLVSDLPAFDAAALRAAAAPAFEVTRGDERTAGAIEERLGRARQEATAGRAVFALRVRGERETTWLAQKPIVDLSALGPPALRNLDVTVLHGVLLAPLLGIDAAAMERQAFLSYTHDTAEALARVERGEVQAAFLMNATPVAQVLAACEAGFVLPQKSTYFQPKLATGLVMYRLDGRTGAAGGQAPAGAGAGAGTGG